MQDADKIERLKEQVHRLSVAKAEAEDELMLLRSAVRDKNLQLGALYVKVRSLLELGTQYTKAAQELVGAND